MKIVHVGQFDPAATAWNLSLALSRYAPQHQSVSVVCDTTLCAPDAHIVAPQSEALAVETIKAADLVVAHCGVNDWSGATHPSTGDYIAVDTHEPGSFFHPWLVKDKTVIWLDGSTSLRKPKNVGPYQRRYAGYKLLATNPDIAMVYGAQWLPPCTAPSLEQPWPETSWPHPEPTLVHPYTDAALKGAPVVAAAVDVVRQWNLVAVHGTAHEDCLNAIHKGQVIVDHFQGYFGVVTLEATVMGKPVLLNLSDGTRLSMLQHGWPVPASWISVSPDNMTAALVALSHALRDPQFLPTLAADAHYWWNRFGHNRHRVQRFVEWLSRI